MAIKIKREAPKPEPEEEVDELAVPDDRIYETSQETFDWLRENRGLVIGGVAAIVVVLIAGSFYLQSRDAKDAQASTATYEVLASWLRPVGEAPNMGPNGPVIPDSEVFATRQEQLAEVQTRAAAALSEYESSKASDETRLLLASAQLEAGDAAAAAENYRTFAEATDSRFGRLVAEIGAAWSTAETGDLNAATQSLTELAQTYEAYSGVIALHGARMKEAYGTSAEALDAYRALLDSDEALRGVNIGAIEEKVALLEVASGAVADSGDVAE